MKRMRAVLWLVATSTDCEQWLQLFSSNLRIYSQEREVQYIKFVFLFKAKNRKEQNVVYNKNVPTESAANECDNGFL